jgi:hypothetical protein
MTLAALWLPIVVGGVLVFVASSVIHMVIKWHVADYRQLANEDAVRDVMRAGSPAPGQYFVPYCPDHKLMRTPEFQRKFTEGPIAIMTVRPNGFPSMGRPLGLWFVFNLVVSALAAWVACQALPPGAPFERVFCLGAVVSFMAYGGGPITQSIWMGKPMRALTTEVLDAVVYAVITGATLALLWPH